MGGGGVRVENTDFTEAAGPLRQEILVHCYRMLGSAADAEDAVQEAFLRAWRGFDRFEGRASVRTWLYHIATNVCLRFVEQRARRVLPAGLGEPESDWRLPAAEEADRHPRPWARSSPCPPGPGLSYGSSTVIGDPEAVRRLLAAVHVPTPADQRPLQRPDDPPRVS
jgi:RNA polymerase sigma-70 factor (ECF subfamily)